MKARASPQTIFPKRLRKARLKKALAQFELGVLAGIDEFSASARVNQYERGVHMPNYSTATRLAEVLDVPVSYLYEPNNKMAELILEASRLDAKGQAAVLKLARKLALNT
ncbi:MULTISPECIES: helix-turn-helix transcriptional regulator [Herbaspirillum]|uniref:helix-turn-helix domain-containing protein n=1 Tax=Herbaspirillum TaxID=963 RepID=UPI000C0AA240|nr:MULTISPECIES: helix-turn-helix transcriptional regulator [Herbaspirillum]MAF04661.1 transcriptional regulator [Herbaspirillum sp.]UWE19346.1 helix-turn-helix domain-containing protein [Herbaspirillum huttiense]|tara:strand:- start:8941 stop:9270 length:330 start_codon:yes stop_codon:yes gene_type:complete